MNLPVIWFTLIAVLWTGYLVLEGFDFGVGMLIPILGRNDTSRRVVLNTIGPFWDGNEVWLLTAGGAMFAAFPHWYATLFSGFYLALLVILFGLIIRALGFEYRGKIDDPRWRAWWDRAIVVGSVIPAMLWGVALTNIVRGVPINADKEFTGNLLTLLNPIGLLGGLTTLVLFLTHGAMFVCLKTDGEIRSGARRIALIAGPIAAVLGVILLLVLNITSGGSAGSWVATVIAAVALLGGLYAAFRRMEGLAFAGTAVAIAGVVASYFLMLYPNVMPSSTNPAWSLTIQNAASSHYTLQIMTVVAVIFTPIVLLYQGWTYWVFRRRIKPQHIPPASGPGGPSAQPLAGVAASPDIPVTGSQSHPASGGVG
jgi:cytochrome d ubiquinol oxidase subunit II